MRIFKTSLYIFSILLFIASIINLVLFTVFAVQCGLSVPAVLFLFLVFSGCSILAGLWLLAVHDLYNRR